MGELDMARFLDAIICSRYWEEIDGGCPCCQGNAMKAINEALEIRGFPERLQFKRHANGGIDGFEVISSSLPGVALDV